MDDVYSAITGSTGIALDDDMPVYQGETTQTLQDYLCGNWSTLSAKRPFYCSFALIDAIDDMVIPTVSLEDIQENFHSEEIRTDEIGSGTKAYSTVWSPVLLL